MKNKLFRQVLIGMALVFPANAHASSAGAPFNANVTHTCSITVTQDGTLDISRNFRRLSSRTGAGIAGMADVVASGSGFTLSVDRPTAFTSKPAGDVTPNRFRAWHSSSGATNYGNRRSPRAINPGTNLVRIHMDARKFNGTGNMFEAGDYSAIVVLRCE